MSVPLLCLVIVCVGFIGEAAMSRMGGFKPQYGALSALIIFALLIQHHQ